MDPLMAHMCLLAALWASLCGAAPVSGSFGVSVTADVSAHGGHTTTLPCWLNPPQSAVGLEVRWYRPALFNSPVMLYRANRFEDDSQEASYAGRVSFGLKDAASGGLTAGDVSLKLVNVTMEDAGDYTCYVSSDQDYDRASVRLVVTETGTPLLLSAVWTEDNMANVSCESEGWFPKPSLRWSGQNKVLTPKSLTYSKDSSGLVAVHSWLLVSSPSEVSCLVGSGEEAKMARVRLDNSPQPVSRSLSAVWLAFALLLLAVIAAVGLLYFKRGRKAKPGRDGAEENQKLLQGEMQPTKLSAAKEHYVNVTLDKKGNPYLMVKDHKLRDARNVPDGSNVTSLTAIKGTPGFSSGQHYWEVSMCIMETDPKQSWWLGVTNESVIPEGLDLTSANCNGYWFLSSSPDRADRLQFNTIPKVLVPIKSRPRTVGVYLDYDGGELSFYNVEDESLIGSFAATFTGEIFPFFNPGKDDISPMKILQRPEQGESGGVGNSEELPEPQTNC
ncbi:butyrophilin subfamily 2 member A2-like [Pempheris klunzingeri]|uniref:butyrophilin subfamily 2 member A2-like n=1 Tax=Pempheris klunzingeri TaxID=3127111 RepID=UPI00397F261E